MWPLALALAALWALLESTRRPGTAAPPPSIPPLPPGPPTLPPELPPVVPPPVEPPPWLPPPTVPPEAPTLPPLATPTAPMVDGWFPQISPSGRILAGHVAIVVGTPGAWHDLGPGGGAVWIGVDRAVINFSVPSVPDGDHTMIVTPSTGDRVTVPIGYNVRMGGANGRWFGGRSDVGMDEYRDNVIVQRHGPGYWPQAVSPDGLRAAWIDRRYDETHTLYVEGVAITTAAVMSASLSNRAICWLEATSRYGRAVKGLSAAGAIVDWSVRNWEDPQIVDGPDGPWILSVTQDPSIVLRPAGSTQGYVIPGELFNPDVTYLDGRFLVVSSSGRGEFQFHRINPADARVDVRVTSAAPSGTLRVPTIDPFDSPKVIGIYTHQGNMGGDGGGINAGVPASSHSDSLRDRDTNAVILPWMDLEHNDTIGGSWDDIAAQPEPTIYYLDVHKFADRVPDNFWPALKPRDVVAFPVYPRAGEALATLEARSAAIIDAGIATGHATILVCAAYTRQNAIGPQTVLDAMVVYRRLADRFGCLGLVFFGVGRADGTAQFPAFLTAIRQFAAPGLPALQAGAGGNVPAPGGGGGFVGGGSYLETTRLDGRVWEGGISFGMTFFAALWGWRHDRDRCVAALDWMAARGVAWIRILGAVGPSGWSDRVIDPRAHGYDTEARELLAACAARGMRVEPTIFGGLDLVPTPADRVALVNRWIAIIGEQLDAIQFAEIANEAYGNGPDALECGQLAERMRLTVPALIATTAPPDEPGAGALWYGERGPANILTMHLDRNVTGEGGMWRPARQAWEVQFMEGVPGAWVSNEPIGPQSSVNADDDPLRLAMSAALAWACGATGYVLHTGPGVRWGGAEDLARGRSINFQDVPNIDAILAGLRSVQSLLPSDIPNWSRANAAWAEHPFAWEGGLKDDYDAGRMVRAFAAYSGDRFFVFPIDVRGPLTLIAKATMRVRVLHPLTGDVIASASLMAGQAFALAHTLPAYIIAGEWL